MYTYVDMLTAWLKSSGIEGYIGSYTWLIPICQTIHFFGLSLLFGIVLMLDLRLLGVLKGLPIRQLTRLIPLALVGFGINLVTGIILYSGAAFMFSRNPAFEWKMAFVALAGINAAVFLMTGLQRKCEALGPEDDAPYGAKAVAICSLVLWVGVMFWGRMLPFEGNSF